jgi:dynein heavy chain
MLLVDSNANTCFVDSLLLPHFFKFFKRYSLSAYLDVFNSSLRKSIPDSFLETRLSNIIDTLTINVYNFATTGLFEQHKLLFSFTMACKLQERDGELSRPELDFFIKGNLALEKSPIVKPHAWIPEQGQSSRCCCR